MTARPTAGRDVKAIAIRSCGLWWPFVPGHKLRLRPCVSLQRCGEALVEALAASRGVPEHMVTVELRFRRVVGGPVDSIRVSGVPAERFRDVPVH